MKIKIAYIGGGSKNWALKYFSDLLLQGEISGEIRLYDIDSNAANLNRQLFEGMKEQNISLIKSEWECKVSKTIDEALFGCDFVLISILPYSLHNMYNDVHYPEKYGLWQSVGDTVGAGGYSRALRTLSHYFGFAQKIREICPDAWVINYTNPMSLCVNALYKEFPEIKAFGCCHEVFGTQKLIAKILSMYFTLDEADREFFLDADLKRVKAALRKKGKRFEKINKFTDITRYDIDVNVKGVNHFTWLDRVEYAGQDIIPVYSAYIKMFRESNKKLMESKLPDFIKYAYNHESVKFELFEEFGCVAAAGDRHLAEFIPARFLNTNKVRKNGFKLTTVKSRLRGDRNQRINRFLKIYFGKRIRAIKSGEEGVNMIIALAGLEPFMSNVNLPNKGQVENLPLGTAVETNAEFRYNRVEPVIAGPIKEDMVGLVSVHARNQKAFIDRFYEKDKAGLVEVFLNDPAVARLSREEGKRLFDELIELNRDCLEPWLLK